MSTYRVMESDCGGWYVSRGRYVICEDDGLEYWDEDFDFESPYPEPTKSAALAVIAAIGGECA
jgi:hypothetical protein